MRAEQLPIAAWIRSVLAEKGWTAYRWSKETGGKVNSTTIKRAVSPDYEGVTSIRILRELADAARVDMPAIGDAPVSSLISAEVLAAILPVVLDVMGIAEPGPDDLHDGASLLRSVLVFLAGEPEAASDPQRARLAARALAQRIGALIS